MDPDRVSLVTGGAGGMGIECSRRFAARGDLVVVFDLDQATVDDVVEDLRSAGGEALGLAGDITDPAAIAALAGEIERRGPLGSVAHTAGLSPTMSSWDRILTVNLVGTVLLLDGLEPLVGEGTAAVCITSQAAHLVGEPAADLAEVLVDALAPDFLDRAGAAGLTDSGGAYAWSKWAVRRLVVTRAPAWGARGARLVSLSPGVIDTPMGQRELAEQPAMPTIIEMTPLQRMGRPDEIAAAVEFLTSPGASFITGTDLLVDGGSTEQLRLLMAGSARPAED